MTETLRRQHLAEAGFNVFRVPSARVPFDVFSDVPHRTLVPDDARGGPEADPDEVAAALAPLCGDAKLALATKGRAAEIALVDAFELAGPPVVLTHGLFTTTQAALARRGAVIEDLRPAASDGTADVDLSHLGERLAAGGVHIVYLELANNALFGWPIREENLAGVREACDRHGVKLVLDAARPLANSVGVGADEIVATARRMLALAHAFTVSCAKELLVPIGSVIGSSDGALIGRACQLLFKAGTSMSPIDPPQQRADLRDGARYALAHPQLVSDRLALARRVKTALVRSGVGVVEPVTAHAVYIPIDRALVPAGDIGAMVSLLSHLYVVAGVRAQIAGSKRGPAIRLALPLQMTLGDAEVDVLARGVHAFLSRLDERVPLQLIDGQHDVAYFRKLAPRT